MGSAFRYFVVESSSGFLFEVVENASVKKLQFVHCSSRNEFQFDVKVVRGLLNGGVSMDRE
jgi:hypothetical protein